MARAWFVLVMLVVLLVAVSAVWLVRKAKAARDERWAWGHTRLRCLYGEEGRCHIDCVNAVGWVNWPKATERMQLEHRRECGLHGTTCQGHWDEGHAAHVAQPYLQRSQQAPPPDSLWERDALRELHREQPGDDRPPRWLEQER